MCINISGSTKMPNSLGCSSKLSVSDAVIRCNMPVSPHAALHGGRWRLMMRWASTIMWVYKSLLFSCCRRPRRGFPNWAKWSHGTSWAAEKQRRAAAQTATMKMGVKHRETVRAKTVSRTQTVHTQLYSVFSLTLSVSSGHIDSIDLFFLCTWLSADVYGHSTTLFFGGIPQTTFAFLECGVLLFLEASPKVAAQKVLEIRRQHALTVRTHCAETFESWAQPD